MCLFPVCCVLCVYLQGYGQAELDTLPGRIGSQDVSDMHTATLAALEVNDVRLDTQRICVAGGSHGGFLTAHLLGQYPSLFRAGACRNPVINVPSMAMVSDITDWCIVEACGVTGSELCTTKPEVLYNFNSYESPNTSQLAMMYHCSPIRHVQNVSAPVLMLLGAKDRRVPVSQGLEFFHSLRRVPDRLTAKVPTEMRLYPGEYILYIAYI
jgi:acylaminoacyl-peptidase